MSDERTVYTSVLVVAPLLALLSVLLLLGSYHEGSQGGAWFWGAAFVVSSFVSAECFWRLL